VIPAVLRQQKFYGWTALVGAMLVQFGMVGNIILSYGVFLPFLCEEFGWSRSVLSGPFTTLWIVLGLLGPLVGISVSKFGSRKNIIIGNLLTVLGLLGMFLVKEVWQVYLFFGVLIGAGQAFGTFIATITVVNNWFIRRRSLAMSLLVAAGGIGGLAFPPFITWLISSLGWRLGWVCLAGIHTVVAVVAGGMLIRNKPEELGQVPDGEVTEAAQEVRAGSPAPRRAYQTPIDWRVGDALRTPALWLVVTFAAAHVFTLNFLTLHQVVYLRDMGFSPMIAATTLGLLAGMSIIGQLGCGALGIRFEGRYLAATCLAGFAIGMTVLMNARALPLIYLHTILSGISYGGLLVIMPVLLGAYFGRASYAQIVGWTTPVTTLFSAGSPLLAGFIYDTTGSYTPAFVAAIALLGVGLVCALLARPPKPPMTIPQ